MTLKFVGNHLNLNFYTSDIMEDKIFAFSKYCMACGTEVDIFNNTGICWMSPDRIHHPSFAMLDNLPPDAGAGRPEVGLFGLEEME